MGALALAFGTLGSATAHAQGVIRAKSTFYQDGSRSSTIVDPDKMTAEETVTDAKGKVLRKVTYVLDETEQPIGSITYDPKGNVMYRASFKRDANGRVAEENISSAEGVFLRKRVYVYGAQNKVANVIEYDAEGHVITPATVRRAKAVSSARKR
jgi:antitoxin component YwqK of YwqJK toxin-antitoxin module